LKEYALYGAEVAEVDALDEKGVNHHLEETFEKTGRIDIHLTRPEFPLRESSQLRS